MSTPERDLLRRLFDAAVAAADPLGVLAPHLLVLARGTGPWGARVFRAL